MFQYSDIPNLPSRESFLDKKASADVDKKIASKTQLEFLPTYLKEINISSEDSKGYHYAILLTGVLRDGRKASVILDKIQPYFEIVMDENLVQREIDNLKKTLRDCPINISNYNIATDNGITMYHIHTSSPTEALEVKKFLVANKIKEVTAEKSITTINIYKEILRSIRYDFYSDMTERDKYIKIDDTLRAKYFKLYQENPYPIIRLYYNYTSSRKSAIKKAIEKGYKTTTNDINNYFRVVARDNLITYSTWSMLKKYKKVQSAPTKFDEKEWKTRTYENIKGLVFKVNIEDYAKIMTPEPDMLKDKTLCCSWDIETFSADNTFPDPAKPEDKLFCLSLTFQWAHEDTPLIQFCLSDKPAKSHSSYMTVYCDTEEKLLKAFARIFARFRPEFIYGFNDGAFDWNYLIEKARLYPGVLTYLEQSMSIMTDYSLLKCSTTKEYDDKVLQRYCRKSNIKIDATFNAPVRSMRFPGYIPIDVRVVFRQLFPTSEQSSLKYYLKENKLGSKDDMPITRMFRIYRTYEAYLKALPESTKKLIRANLQAIANSNYSQDESLDYKEDETPQDVKPLDADEVFDDDDDEEEEDDTKTSSKPPRVQEEDGPDDGPNDYEETLIPLKDKIVDDGDEQPATAETKISLDDYPELKVLSYELMTILKYCVIDAWRCHELIKIRSVIMDRREVSDLSYVSVEDAFYYANGMKVRNLTIAKGQKSPFNLRFSNLTSDTFSSYKYPGAFVHRPEVGPKISKLPIAWLPQKQIPDGVSQEDVPAYEKLISVTQMAHCATEEDVKTITDKATELNIKLKPAFVDYLKEPIGRPITGLDFSSLYPSLIRTYNFSPEYCVMNETEMLEIQRRKGYKFTHVEFPFGPMQCKAYFVSHENHIDPKDPEFRFGIYPYVLNELFNQRAVIKKEMKKYDSAKEEMEAEETKHPGYLKANREKYEDICFMKNYLNTKQGALKIFMNTFYGECGNQRSAFCIIELAGGVTQYGKINLIKAFNYVQELGCHVYYGDTDSLYISMPEKTFKDIDVLHYSGKMERLAYWTEMVERTFQTIKPINEAVNNMFLQDNGTKFLSMAYEEVLYPVVFTAKKKYYGIPHESKVNFQPKQLFIRGLDVKRRGVSGLLRKIVTDLMWTSMSPSNPDSLIELVMKAVDDVYNKQWDFHYFVQTDTYKPAKKNVKVLTFVKRMAQKGIDIEPNERFEYIISKKYPYQYASTGHKETLSIGDRMELLSEAQKNKLEVDLDYYVETMNGQLARLITYHPNFIIHTEQTDPVELKKVDDKIYQAAKKFMNEYASKYFAKYNDFGRIYRDMYKKANGALGGQLLKREGAVGELFKLVTGEDRNYIEFIKEKAQEKATKLTAEAGRKYINNIKNQIIDYVTSRYEKSLAEYTQKNKPTPEALATHIKDISKQKAAEIKKLYQYQLSQIILLYIKECNYGGQKIKGGLQTLKRQFNDRRLAILESRLNELLEKITIVFRDYIKGINNITYTLKKKINIQDLTKPIIDPAIDAQNFKLSDLIQEDVDPTIERNAEIYLNKLYDDQDKIAVIKELKKIYYNMVSCYMEKLEVDHIVEEIKKERDSFTGYIDTRRITNDELVIDDEIKKHLDKII
jgi:DNA polymerase elongation subunit (family B)